MSRKMPTKNQLLCAHVYENCVPPRKEYLGDYEGYWWTIPNCWCPQCGDVAGPGMLDEQTGVKRVGPRTYENGGH